MFHCEHSCSFPAITGSLCGGKCHVKAQAGTPAVILNRNNYNRWATQITGTGTNSAMFALSLKKAHCFTSSPPETQSTNLDKTTAYTDPHNFNK